MEWLKPGETERGGVQAYQRTKLGKHGRFSLLRAYQERPKGYRPYHPGPQVGLLVSFFNAIVKPQRREKRGEINTANLREFHASAV